MLGDSPMNLYGATATSGAGAGDIGVAGSVAINIVTNTSRALIEAGASVNANGGDVSLTALNNSSDTTLAFPGAGGQGGSLGIGASLALNIITNDTQAEIQDGAALDRRRQRDGHRRIDPGDQHLGAERGVGGRGHRRRHRHRARQRPDDGPHRLRPRRR